MRLSEQSLPEDWQVSPTPLSTADIGDQWLDQTGSALLAVPNVIVPQEVNYLLNPAHPQQIAVAGGDQLCASGEYTSDNLIVVDVVGQRAGCG